MKLIAIDFDGTITDKVDYPKKGAIREDAKKYIKALHKRGYILCLWTSRKPELLQDALDRLEDAQLLQYFTFINDDGADMGNRKIDADFYIDDKSYIGEDFSWQSVYEYIVENI